MSIKSTTRRWRRVLSLLVAGALGGTALGAVTASPAAAARVEVGGLTFDVGSAEVARDLYQVAYSERNDAVWVTATTHHWDLGYPVAEKSTITKIDPESLEVEDVINPEVLDAGTATERPEAAYGIAVDDEHNTLWTSATREDALVVYDQATGDKITTIPDLGHTRDIAIDEYRDIAWVSDPNNGQLWQIDTSTYEVIEKLDRSILGSSFSPMSLDIVADDDTALIYTVNLSNGQLLEINDLIQDVRVFDTGGGRASGVAVDAERNRAYVSSQGDGGPGDVRTIDLDSGDLVNTVEGSGGALNSAVDPDGGVVYSTLFWANHLQLTDATTGACIGELPIGASPNDVIFAGGAVWAVDRDPRGSASHLWRVTPTGGELDPDTCGDNQPPASTADVTVEGEPKVGGQITVKGTGWTHPDGTGSVVAIKLDDGRIQRADGTGDVWQTIEADELGNFTATVTLPNGGTTGAGGSKPAYEPGEHSLRFLTGSLKPGDTIRSIRRDVTVDVGAPVATTLPSITGQPKVGSTLTAQPGTWQAEGDPSFEFQWLRGGKAISGATGATYRVTAADLGANLKVRVAATTDDGTGSADSAVVKVAKASAKVTAKVTQQPRVGKAGKVTVTVASAGNPAGGKVTLKVKGKAAKTAKVSGTKAVLVFPKGVKAGKHQVTITYAGSSSVAKATTRIAVTVRR